MKKLYLVLLFSTVLFSNDCTKNEVMSMVDKGFSKSDIDKICNETLKNLKCCCHKYIETYDDHNGELPMRWAHDRTEYEWISADKCSASIKTGAGLFGGKKIKMSCGNKSMCGR